MTLARKTTLERKTPIRRKRSKPRRVAASCAVRGCRRRPVPGVDLCATHCKREADRLFSLLVRSVGRCEMCGTTTNLQCAHIVSRRYAATRYDSDNSLCLDAKCHTYFTHHPLEWEQWVYARIGFSYDLLKKKALAGGKPDWVAILSDLRNRYQEAT